MDDRSILHALSFHKRVFRCISVALSVLFFASNENNLHISHIMHLKTGVIVHFLFNIMHVSLLNLIGVQPPHCPISVNP